MTQKTNNELCNKNPRRSFINSNFHLYPHPVGLVFFLFRFTLFMHVYLCTPCTRYMNPNIMQ